jgi:hypothetical protein
MRRLALGLLAVAGMGFGVAPALATESVTTRIEPRPFYGATVTVESGVRVFRPLPPHDRIIVNPGNAPIYLGVGAGAAPAAAINQNVTVDRAAPRRW